MLKRPLKSRGVGEGERRRAALEAQQKQDRQRLLSELRGLAEETPKADSSFAEKLMFPDWLIEKPNDLNSNWLVQLRPEGKRCILLISHGRVHIRSKQGRLLTPVPIMEPSLISLGTTILDCVVPDTIRGYACALYVMDVIYWDDAAIAESEAEFRHYWLKSRFSELSFDFSSFGETIDFKVMRSLPPLIYVEPKDARGEVIEEMYSNHQDYATDSFIFTHKESQYVAGLSPLQLQWRDRRLSRFVIDTSDFEGDRLPERQKVVLQAKVGKSGKIKLKTWDGVKVAKLQTIEGIKESCLVRLTIAGVESDGSIKDPLSIVRIPPGRVFPDSHNRIKSQAYLRANGGNIVPLTELTGGLVPHSVEN